MIVRTDYRIIRERILLWPLVFYATVVPILSAVQ